MAGQGGIHARCNHRRAGAVGATLGQAWLKHGQDVIWGLRNPADPKYAALAKERVKAPAVAVKEAEIVVPTGKL